MLTSSLYNLVGEQGSEYSGCGPPPLLALQLTSSIGNLLRASILFRFLLRYKMYNIFCLDFLLNYIFFLVLSQY